MTLVNYLAFHGSQAIASWKRNPIWCIDATSDSSFGYVKDGRTLFLFDSVGEYRERHQLRIFSRERRTN